MWNGEATGFGTKVGFALIAYVVLDRVLVRAAKLAEESYYGTSIAVETLRNVVDLVFRFPALSILLVAALLAGIVWKQTAAKKGIVWIIGTWKEIGVDPAIRWVVVVATAVLAWTYSTYDHNLYFDQAHSIDRLLLVALAISVVWRPVLVLPFVLLSRAIMGQFSVVLGGYSWATQSLPLAVLILVAATLLIGAVRRDWRDRDFVALLLCAVAGHYLWSGWAKLSSGWLLHDDVYLVLTNSYANGWLAGLEPSRISALARGLSTVNLPMKIFTLIVELGVVAILASRRVAVMVILGILAMHAGIFVVCGILFWKWAAVEIAILGLILSRGRFDLTFTRTAVLFSIPILLLSGIVFRPPTLFWFDTPMTYTYRYEAIAASGRTYAMPPLFFSPYDYQFTFRGAVFMVREPRVRAGSGATSKDVVDRIRGAAERGSPLTVETTAGAVLYDSTKAMDLRNFLRRFLTTRHSRRNRMAWWSSLSPPADVWTFSRKPVFNGQETIDSVRVSEITSYFNGSEYTELRQVEVETFPLRADSAATPTE